MQLAVELAHYVTGAAALILATVAALQAGRGGRAGRWGAAAFGALAVALLIRAVDEAARPEWTVKVLVCFLLAFPYLLLRFTESFVAVPVVMARLAAGSLAALLAATVALPFFPEDGAARPGWYTAYIVVGAAFWTALAGTTMVGLWRGGAGRPTLMRRRVRLMSAATGGINVVVLVLAGGDEGGVELALQALLLVSLAAFAVGLAPPVFVRLAWRQPEQEALRRATEELVRAGTVSEVTDTLLPHVASIVGGSGAALWDEDGTVVASFGSMPHAEGDPGSRDGARLEALALSPPFGSLVVATSSLTPFFGREELRLLHALAALADLSLTRCVLHERERESRRALLIAMEDAKRANMAKSDFLSRTSHELRTPLNAVLGFGQILEMSDSLGDDDREAVEQILKAGRHLLELINEVLDLSRIESGQMAISPEPVELAGLTDEALDLIRPLAQERSVRLLMDVGRCDRHVIADRQRLKQVLLNLLSNAIKYNHEGGEVAVSCVEPEQGRLRLRVQDTGPGIPAPWIDRLFEPFERLGAERGPVEGTGLGLALSSQLVKLMGGEIGVDSREGEGSTFWLELPSTDAPGAARIERVHVGRRQLRPAPSSGHRRLLLIEDNLSNIKVIQQLMGRRPHIELLPAITGGLGIELARQHRPDLILLDQHLPDVTGAEVLRRLQADPATRHIPVVVLSADATDGQIRRMLELGAVEYLTKPFAIPNFLQVVDGILARSTVP